jgi:hypothetical protein
MPNPLMTETDMRNAPAVIRVALLTVAPALLAAPALAQLAPDGSANVNLVGTGRAERRRSRMRRSMA